MAVHKLILAACFAALALTSLAAADDTPAEREIEYLIAAIGDSGCTFIRNGKRYDAREAEAHIRMKHRRARRHAKTAEMFIARLASKSSISRKPYLMDCSGEDIVPSGDWLSARLTDYRAAQQR